MSNGFKWELSKWGDNSIRLVFWDAISAHDVIYLLNPDGTADEVLTDDNDSTTFVRVNLVEALRLFLTQSMPL